MTAFAVRRPRRGRSVVALGLAGAALSVGVLAGCTTTSTVRPTGPVSTASALPPTSVTTSPATPAVAGSPAGGVAIYLRAGELVSLTDAQLQRLHDLGITEIVGAFQHIEGLGGAQRYTADLADPLTGSDQSVQRALQSTQIVQRAAALGIRSYFSFYLVNPTNVRTPLVEWFDDAGWATATAAMRDTAAAAKAMGFAGLGFDEELYPQTGGARGATWDWNYPGNRNTEAAVRAEVKQRGVETMTALLQGFPGLSIIDYGQNLPETWLSHLVRNAKGTVDAYRTSVTLNFWDGLTSVPGYDQVLFLDEATYKATQVEGTTWDEALAYDQRSFFSLMSRSLSAWPSAADHIAQSPFAWIDDGGTRYSRLRPDHDVREQVAAFRRWGMDGVFGLYQQHGVDGLDYAKYLLPLAATGGSPGKPPTIGVTPVSGAATGVTVRGWAQDAKAVRVVRWSLGGQTGTALLAPVTGNPERGGDARVQWSFELPAGTAAGDLQVSAEGIDGVTATVSTPVA